MTVRSACLRTLVYSAILALAPLALVHPAPAQQTGLNTVPAVAPVAGGCPRAAAGGVIQQPPALFSSNGVLNVQFSYQTTTDQFGRMLFCLVTPSGMEEPTLHINPGDTLNVTVTNNKIGRAHV